MMIALFITAPILTFIALSIVIINILTLSTMFTSPQLLKPGNYPIVSFLLTALVQGFVVVPAYCIKHLQLNHSSKWICDVFRFPYFVCSHLLTLNLVIVCLDRIIAIKLPLRYDAIVTRSNMLIAIGTETFAVVVVDLLPFANGHTDDECFYSPWPSWSISVVVVTVLFPIVFLTLTYAWIWLIAFRVAENPSNTNFDESTSLKNKITARVTKILELRATKTASLLVGVFVLCWGPIAVYYLVENLCGHCIMVLFDKKAKEVVSLSVKVVSFASSIISPFVYCWRTREFQREFRRNLTRRHWRAARIALSFMNWAAKAKSFEHTALEGLEGEKYVKRGSREMLNGVKVNGCDKNAPNGCTHNFIGDRNTEGLEWGRDEFVSCTDEEYGKQIACRLDKIENTLQTTTL